MRRLALIPARGGSKRIPRKNIRLFSGKPVIAWSISAAVESRLFDTVMVSTEDVEIARVAREYGAEIPFMRTRANADDHATTFDVIDEVLARYREKGDDFDECVCIYPCAPLITADVLAQGVEALSRQGVDSVIPVVQGQTIQRAMQVVENKLEFVDDRYTTSRSQDLSPAFFDTGQFYCFGIAPVLAAKSVLTANTMPLIVDELSVQNIDTESDWALAEWKFQRLRLAA